MVGIKQRRIRARQAMDSAAVTHPSEKTQQLYRVLDYCPKSVLEVFAGSGQLTQVYEDLGSQVTAWDKRLGTGDSYLNLLQRAGSETYDVVDIDPYGFPSRAFPHVFLYLTDGYLFLTFPKPGVQWLNGITQKHLEVWWGSSRPSREDILRSLEVNGLRYWRTVEEIECMDLGRLWRFALRVRKVKATEYCNVRNAARRYPQGRLF